MDSAYLLGWEKVWFLSFIHSWGYNPHGILTALLHTYGSVVVGLAGYNKPRLQPVGLQRTFGSFSAPCHHPAFELNPPRLFAAIA